MISASFYFRSAHYIENCICLAIIASSVLCICSIYRGCDFIQLHSNDTRTNDDGVNFEEDSYMSLGFNGYQLLHNGNSSEWTDVGSCLAYDGLPKDMFQKKMKSILWDLSFNYIASTFAIFIILYMRMLVGITDPYLKEWRRASIKMFGEDAMRFIPCFPRGLKRNDETYEKTLFFIISFIYMFINNGLLMQMHFETLMHKNYGICALLTKDHDAWYDTNPLDTDAYEEYAYFESLDSCELGTNGLQSFYGCLCQSLAFVLSIFHFILTIWFVRSHQGSVFASASEVTKDADEETAINQELESIQSYS